MGRASQVFFDGRMICARYSDSWATVTYFPSEDLAFPSFRVACSNVERLAFVALYRLAPKVLNALEICRARGGCTLPSHWLPGLVGAGSHKGTVAGCGHSPAHDGDERRRSLVGSTTDSRDRARCRTNHGSEIHGQEKAGAFARMQSLALQSRRPSSDERAAHRPYHFASVIISGFRSRGMRGRSSPALLTMAGFLTTIISPFTLNSFFIAVGTRRLRLSVAVCLEHLVESRTADRS